jgi:hypothetical protein
MHFELFQACEIWEGGALKVTKENSDSVFLSISSNAPLSIDTKPQAPLEMWRHNFIRKCKRKAYLSKVS